MHFSTFLLSTFTSLLINHHSIIATSPSIILLTFVWTCEFYPTTCPHFLENMMIQWSTHVKPKINIPAFLGKSKRPSGNNTYGQLAFSLFFGESTPQPWESIGCLMVFWGKPRESIGFFWGSSTFHPMPFRHHLLLWISLEECHHGCWTARLTKQMVRSKTMVDMTNRLGKVDVHSPQIVASWVWNHHPIYSFLNFASDFARECTTLFITLRRHPMEILPTIPSGRWPYGNMIQDWAVFIIIYHSIILLGQ